MRLRRFLLLICFLAGTVAYSQYSLVDSIPYSADTRLEDGIFLTHLDFRWNKAVRKAQIVSDLDREQLEFIGKTLFEEHFSYEEENTVIRVASKNVWGYVQNNTLYVNYKGDFYRVPVFGSISYLVATVTVVTPGFYDPRFGMYTGTGTTRELREFVMDFYDGQMVEFKPQTVEKLLARDPGLYGEYTKLNRRKQKEQVYAYIRKYNTLHPVYFLITKG